MLDISVSGPDKEKFAVLWSGGKDSCLALQRAHQSGLHVGGLLNFFDESSGRVRFHGVRAPLIVGQANALRLELFQHGTLPDTFAGAFAAALGDLKARGYAGVVAGDIHLEDVRQWNEEQAFGAGLQLVEPLWHLGGPAILEEFVAAGFRAVLTCCDKRWAELLRPGREIDHAFILEASHAHGLDVCGENGEYHSFVIDGPLFSRRVGFTTGEVRRGNGFSQIDLIPDCTCS